MYEVERIMDRRKTAVGLWEYLIKWKGYPESENSWEPTPNITAATLRAFWKRVGIMNPRKRASRGREP